jgi:hypothetical protein
MKHQSKLGDLLNRIPNQTPHSRKLQQELSMKMPEKKSTSTPLSRATNRSQSRKSEADIELVTGLKRNPGSGCGKIFKGDNGDKNWHIEDKSTRQDKIVIKLVNFEKAKYQAKITNKKYFAVSYTKNNKRFYHIESALLDTLDGGRSACLDIHIVPKQSKSFSLDELIELTTERGIDIHFMNKTMTSIINESSFVQLMQRIQEELDGQGL